MKQEAIVSLNGDVSELQKGVTFRYFNGKKDHQNFTKNSNETWKIVLGTYTFDKIHLLGSLLMSMFGTKLYQMRSFVKEHSATKLLEVTWDQEYFLTPVQILP